MTMAPGAESNPKEADQNELPTFAGPTPGIPRIITIPTVDISAETARHSIVARGKPDTYHGHCDTVLLPDVSAVSQKTGTPIFHIPSVLR